MISIDSNLKVYMFYTKNYDVIVIGGGHAGTEAALAPAMSASIAYAQSGHLCLATLHANNSYHALNRILSFYPVEVRPTLLGDLASALKSIVSQRLIRTVDGLRTPAMKVILNTKLVADLIEKGDFTGVKEAMENSMAEGSQTFEADLARLINEGRIDRKEGLAYADSPTNLLWRLQNDTSRHIATQQAHIHEDAIADEPSFTDITLDVHNSAFRTTGFGSSGFDRTTGFGSSHLGPLDDPKLGKQS